MKPVQGFLADDGTFFSNVHLANKHDAEMNIRVYCSEKDIDAEKLINHIEALADPIMRFVNASQEERTFNENQSRTIEKTGTLVDPAYDTERKDDLKTVLEQSPDRPEPVPNVGSSPFAESVFDNRKSLGLRSR